MSRVVGRIEKAAPLLAWTAASATITASAAAAVLAATGGSPEVPWKQILLAAMWAIPGALIAAGRPRIAIGWLVLGVALFFAGSGLADQWVRRAVASHTNFGVDWSIWFVDRFAAFLVVLTVLALILLPDGRLPSRRWRPVVWAVLGLQCASLIVWALVSGPAAAPDSDFATSLQRYKNPAGILPASWGYVVQRFEGVLLQGPLLLCPVIFAVRLRLAKGDERTRLTSVLLAATIFVLLVVLGHALWPAGALLLDVAGGLLLAAALTQAVLRRRIPGIEVVVHHAIVYTLLTVLIAGFYMLVVTVALQLGQDLPAFGAGVLAAVIAVAALPLRDRLQHLVDRMLYGDRRRPYEGLRRLADKTNDAPNLGAVMTELASVVATSLRVPWVHVETGSVRSVWGERPSGAEEITAPLLSRGARVGTISAAAGPGRHLGKEETQLLADLGRYGGVVVHSVLLADAVLASRQRLVVAREGERRRIRRDLHDELGPTMATITMQLGALREMVWSDPAAASERLSRLQDASRQTLEAIRRVARELRPPVLDQLGLVTALRQLADGLGLTLHMDAVDLPPLPAAVEVAAYRIAAESLTNISRHAGTNQARLSLELLEGALALRIIDDGRGFDAGRNDGVGTLSIRERAEELGGSVNVESAPGNGTTVSTTLPLTAARSEGVL